MKIVIVGAGGHGQVAADILMGTHEEGNPGIPVGYLDENESLWGRKFLGIEVLGGLSHLAKVAHDAVIVAIGDNRKRREIFLNLLSQGERFAIACHPRAIIASDVKIGLGCMVCAGVVVNPGTEVGENVILNTGCIVEHHNRIEAHAHIAPGATLGGEVVVEEGTLVGIGATVMPRCKIGSWSVIGAGAMVNENIPDSVIAVGVPAVLIKN